MKRRKIVHAVGIQHTRKPATRCLRLLSAAPYPSGLATDTADQALKGNWLECFHDDALQMGVTVLVRRIGRTPVVRNDLPSSAARICAWR
jgi:hypothetical protein